MPGTRLLSLLCLMAVWAAQAAQAFDTGIIVPLYIYPASAPTCDAWSPLTVAIFAYPAVPFFIIVNPDSGPGSANTQPSSDYADCVPKLMAPNVKILGYVDTAEGSRATSAVVQDIDTYAGWSSAYRPVGVFFDNVDPSSALLSTYTSWAASARAAFNSGSGFVIFNPGTSVAVTEYFTIADQIVTADNFYSDFSSSQLIINSNSPASQQSVILHDGPTTVPSTLILQLVRGNTIGSLFITDATEASGNPYGVFPTAWFDFVDTVDAEDTGPGIVSGKRGLARLHPEALPGNV